jgi:hypothetical protein
MVRVLIIESEAGWGQRIDEVKEFESHDEADEFIERFNSHNDKEQVPSWYMYATKEY